MKVLELKALETDQLDAVVELDQRSLGGMWTIEGYRREMDSPNSDLLILQQMTPQQILGVGCVWAILDEAHITTLAIDPTVQRQGWGSVMLQALLRAARRRELEWATLEVRVSNLGAIALYEKFGFEPLKHPTRWMERPASDAY